MAIERIIGVDFGTSTSVIRVKRYEDGQPVGNALETQAVTFNMGQVMVPTLIQQYKGTEFYGYDAQVARKGAEVHQNFKTELESDDIEIRTCARILTEEFFVYLARRYKEQDNGGFFGEEGDQEKTIVSYPVKWRSETKAFLLEAARKAGFPSVTGKDEAQAAIQAVAVQFKDKLRQNGYLHSGSAATILLVDMGAGTTDLVLCRYTPDSEEIELLSVWPRNSDINFSGREVDEYLRSYIRGKLEPELAEQVMRRIGLEKFKAWKEHTVSPALERKDTVSEFSDLDTMLDILGEEMAAYSLDRAEFERLLDDYLSNLPLLVDGCVKEAGINPGEIDLVILSGGHSQWYFVADLLASKATGLKKIAADPGRIIRLPRPQETDALGLVYEPLGKQLSFQKTAELSSWQANEKYGYTNALAPIVLPSLWNNEDTQDSIENKFDECFNNSTAISSATVSGQQEAYVYVSSSCPEGFYMVVLERESKGVYLAAANKKELPAVQNLYVHNHARPNAPKVSRTGSVARRIQTSDVTLLRRHPFYAVIRTSEQMEIGTVISSRKISAGQVYVAQLEDQVYTVEKKEQPRLLIKRSRRFMGSGRNYIVSISRECFELPMGGEISVYLKPDAAYQLRIANASLLDRHVPLLKNGKWDMFDHEMPGMTYGFAVEIDLSRDTVRIMKDGKELREE